MNAESDMTKGAIALMRLIFWRGIRTSKFRLWFVKPTRNMIAKIHTESLACGTSNGMRRSHAGSYGSGRPPRWHFRAPLPARRAWLRAHDQLSPSIAGLNQFIFLGL